MNPDAAAVGDEPQSVHNSARRQKFPAQDVDNGHEMAESEGIRTPHPVKMLAIPGRSDYARLPPPNHFHHLL
jgi:hypothetical protein